MKCPHCNQDHPDDFQFCPVTGKKLEQLKACSNPDCPNHDKHVLPFDACFCPACGCELPESQINPPRDSHSELFDLTLLSAGDTRLQVTKAIKDIFNFDLSKIVRIVNNAPCLIASAIPKEKAEKYKKAIESFGATIEISRRVIADNSQSMSNKQSVTEELPCCRSCWSDDVTDDGTGYMQYTCNECGNIWGNRDDIECPECGSMDVIDDGTGTYQFECNNCGRIWGDDEKENNINGVEEEIPFCMKCYSDDVTDDGTGCMQYECNECGNIWGNREDIECPECGSTDVFDDGSDCMPYECNNCGHVFD